MEDAIPEIIRFVDEVRMVGFTHALLLGMGGSSLAPEVFRFTFGVKEGYLDLSVLDSTHPNAILNVEKRIDISKTLFIVSTKSGGTVETMSFMKYFYNKTVEAVGSEKVGRHFVAITDPKSGLEELARKLNFRKIFLNDPNIGGRYSALSYFGLVPAALIGVDIKILLERAVNMLRNSESLNIRVGEENSGVWLGTIMGELAKLGRDKVTLITSPGIEQFGAWAEQLIAESTGKEGRGILPVDGELLVKPHEYKNDRLFVYLHLDDEDKYAEKVRLLIDTENPVVKFDLTDKYDLGGEFYRWIKKRRSRVQHASKRIRFCLTGSYLSCS
jgi:glucose-6-phosphate isomerase